MFSKHIEKPQEVLDGASSHIFTDNVFFSTLISPRGKMISSLRRLRFQSEFLMRICWFGILSAEELASGRVEKWTRNKNEKGITKKGQTHKDPQA